MAAISLESILDSELPPSEVQAVLQATAVVEFSIVWPIFQDSVANLFWRDHEFALKSAMMALGVGKYRADLAKDCYCRTRFGRELLKYLCDATEWHRQIQIERISRETRILPAKPRARRSDMSVKLLAKEC